MPFATGGNQLKAPGLSQWSQPLSWGMKEKEGPFCCSSAGALGGTGLGGRSVPRSSQLNHRPVGPGAWPWAGCSRRPPSPGPAQTVLLQGEEVSPVRLG